MDRDQAHRKYATLLRMTTARGCTRAEAETAARLAARLAKTWAFTPSYERAEAGAARRWRWEYRRCGKRRCHCVRGRGHGPYKYEKRREGQKVRSVYRGR